MQFTAQIGDSETVLSILEMLVFRKAPSTVGRNSDFDVDRSNDFEYNKGIVKFKIFCALLFGR